MLALFLHQKIFNIILLENLGFDAGSDGKESTCNAGDSGLISGLGRFSGEGNGYPLQYSLPGEFYGQRSLAGYSPWGHKESHRTELLTHTHIGKLFFVATFLEKC